MHNIAKLYQECAVENYLGPARVIKQDVSENYLRIAVTGRQGAAETTARPLISISPPPAAGDEVLVIENNSGEFFVIGILSQAAPASGNVRLNMADGKFASIVSSENGQILNVYSHTHELLFEYDPASKKARIFSDAQHVVFEAPKGDMELNAAGNLRLKGHHVEITARSGIQLSAGKIVEALKSALLILPGKIDASALEVKVTARRAGVVLDEAVNTIKTAVHKIGTLKLLAGKIETTAATLIEKTKNSYRTMENLNQVKAGRMRMLINKTFHLKSKSSVIKAEDDVKVKGEKIHLG
ncbi:MAG: DUF3540 domain-containing protein [Desulfobacteraceae bacterium]|nr:MAG: DUF3540 domain-containing protein [Desulfobacteraceae bacterium]